MSNYPNSFDNDTTLPPAVFEEVVSTYRFSCEINPNSSSKLKDPLGASFVLPAGKSTSIRVSCFVVQIDEPMVVAQFVKYVGAHCSVGGTVRINFDEDQFSYNPEGFFEIASSVGGTSANLDITITNNSFRKAKAAAVVEYVSV